MYNIVYMEYAYYNYCYVLYIVLYIVYMEYAYYNYCYVLYIVLYIVYMEYAYYNYCYVLYIVLYYCIHEICTLQLLLCITNQETGSCHNYGRKWLESDHTDDGYHGFNLLEA